MLATGFEPSFDELLCEPERFLAAGQPGKGVPPRYLMPRTDGHDRSAVDPALFFVGSDHAVNGGMAMGMQGWSCGFRVAQSLGRLPPAARFSLDALPERQRDVIAARRVQRNALWGVVAVAAVAVVAALAARGRSRQYGS